VIFFNSVAYLGMCGHGTIGVVATLAYLGRIGPGTHRIETPVGVVVAHLDAAGQVEVANVASYRLAKNVTVEVPGFGPVTGDVAWGGNWFFLVNDHAQQLELENLEKLMEFTRRVRDELARAGVKGSDGHEIDHVELFGPSQLAGVNSKNFVLCPGNAYDRSPCGTGTSAKLACLFADGKLDQGQVWRQEVTTYYSFEVVSQLVTLLEMRVARVANELRLQHLNLMPLLDQSLETFYDCFHLTPAGAMTVARAIADTLLSSHQEVIVPKPGKPLARVR